MFDTMTRWLEGVARAKDRWSLRKILFPLVDRYSSLPLTSAGLEISSTTTLAKTGSADFYAAVQGSLVKIAAGTNMPALTGINISAGYYNVVCFYVNAAGTVSVVAGQQASTLGGVVFPQPPSGEALVGFLIITYASAFTGGTTVLSTATTVYVSPIGPFDATVLTGAAPGTLA